jgi:DNA-binding CsgD family transcriptional regulator
VDSTLDRMPIALQMEASMCCNDCACSRRLKQIASMLAGGHTIASISDRCAITNAPVRWHLKNVVAKTETSRQADLVRLLAVGPNSISGSRVRPASVR